MYASYLRHILRYVYFSSRQWTLRSSLRWRWNGVVVASDLILQLEKALLSLACSTSCCKEILSYLRHQGQFQGNSTFFSPFHVAKSGDSRANCSIYIRRSRCKYPSLRYHLKHMQYHSHIPSTPPSI
jgi:hypothetical protein